MRQQYKCKFWRYENIHLDECRKILKQTADEYLKKAESVLDDYADKGFTHMTFKTIGKIPGFYAEQYVVRHIDEFEYETISPGESSNIGICYAMEIGSLKNWLKNKYRIVGNVSHAKYPKIVYDSAEKECEKLGLYGVR